MQIKFLHVHKNLFSNVLLKGFFDCKVRQKIKKTWFAIFLRWKIYSFQSHLGSSLLGFLMYKEAKKIINSWEYDLFSNVKFGTLIMRLKGEAGLSIWDGRSIFFTFFFLFDCYIFKKMAWDTSHFIISNIFCLSTSATSKPHPSD